MVEHQQIEHFDSCFQVVASFIDALQKNFKEDMRYAYPLIPPHANTLFVLDEDVAEKMKQYVCKLIQETCGFAEKEFRITERHALGGGGLHKLRLEFSDGIDFDMIRRIIEKTSLLEQRVLQRKMAQ